MDQTLVIHQKTLKHLGQFIASPVHAIGIYGEDGAGKGHMAAYLSSRLLGVSVEYATMHPYVKVLDAVAAKTGIDDIRDLQKFLTLTVPGEALVRRVAIIEHFDCLGREAQTALLKTLEEPPADTVIILTYSRSTNILPTIHSRLQTIQILPIGLVHARQYFQAYDKDALQKAYLISGGLPGLMLALLRGQGDHLLIKAIERARETLRLSRFQRLAMVDKICKDNEVSPAILLDGLYKIVDASYRQSLKVKDTEQLKNTVKKLNLIEKAINDLDQNVQAKLVMSRLFLEL